MLSKSIGTNIKLLRSEKGLSQDSLASSIFVTRQTVSNYETGHSHPDLDMLQKIADVLDVDVLHLLYGKPLSPEKRASKKKLMILTVIFVGLLILTAGLFPYTWNLHYTHYIAAPICFHILKTSLKNNGVCPTIRRGRLLLSYDYFPITAFPK